MNASEIALNPSLITKPFFINKSGVIDIDVLSLNALTGMFILTVPAGFSTMPPLELITMLTAPFSFPAA
jgi:hypothetical protein